MLDLLKFVHKNNIMSYYYFRGVLFINFEQFSLTFKVRFNDSWFVFHNSS